MNNLIFNEIKSGNLEGVKSLLNDTTKKATSPKGVGILSYAIITEQSEIFDYLLNELDSSEIMEGLHDPVDLSIQYNEHKYLEKLLKSGKIDNNHNSVYLISAYQLNADKKTLNILEEAGYSLDKPAYSSNGYSAFNTLLSSDKDILLKIDNDKLNELINFDSFIVLSNDRLPQKDTLDKILSFKDKLSNEEKGLVFKSSINQGNIILLSEIMNMAGFYPTNDQVLDLLNTSILFQPKNADENNAQNEIEKIFLENDIPFYDYSDKFGISILSSCIKNHKNNLLINFLNRGADINERASKNKYSNGYTPLHFAVECGNEFAIDSLLESNATTTVQDSNGNTPLHLAVKSGNKKIFNKLLNNGSAYIDSVNNSGYTPISLAILAMDKFMISQLLWKGANLFRIDLFKDDSLNLESLDNNQYQNTFVEQEKKQLNTFRDLANLNFNIYQINEDGETFPHVFIKKGNVKNLKAFFDIGYNPNVVDNKGNNILMLAINSNNEIFDLVCKHIKETPNYQFFTKNEKEQDIYDLLLEKKDVKRLTQVILMEIQSTDYLNRNKTKEHLEKVLPFITMHGNLYDLSPSLELMMMQNKTRLLDKKGNPLLMFAMMSKNYDNMEYICSNKPEQIITPTTNGKSPIELLEGIKDKDPITFNRIKGIFISYFSEEILESLGVQDIRKNNFTGDIGNKTSDTPDNIKINRTEINKTTQDIINKIKHK